MAVQLAFYIRDRASPPLGFQEVYYFSATDPTTYFNLAVSGSSPWVFKRQKFLSSSCEIYAVRCSHVGSPKQSKLVRYASPIQGVKGPQDTIEDCLAYLGFSDAGLVKRQFHFRGIDQTWIESDKLTAFGLGGLPLIYGSATAFIDTMIGNGLMMLGGKGSTTTLYDITAAAKATQDAPITITAPNAPAIPTGTLIEIRGSRQAPLLNGRWQNIGSPLAGAVTLSGSQRYSSPAVISGKLFVVNPTLYAVSTLQFNSVTSKKTGRPSFLQRGRQSAKLRHR